MTVKRQEGTIMKNLLKFAFVVAAILCIGFLLSCGEEEGALIVKNNLSRRQNSCCLWQKKDDAPKRVAAIKFRTKR